MGRSSSNEKIELKKGPWTREEDQKLLAYIEENGHGSWRSLPAKAGLQRCGKSCRLRWTNYLRPDIKRGKFSTQEEKTIIRLHALLGNRWSAIATHLPKRTDNEIKNYWNTRLKKRLTRMGIDPATHKPKNNANNSSSSKQAANLSHMAQWETARLEAEARLCRESKFLSNLHFLRRGTVPPQIPPSQPGALPCLDVLKVWQATSRANCFFVSTGSLQSPTSTLNFSDSTSTTITAVGAGSSFMGNDVNNLNIYRDLKGKMENPMQILDDQDNNHNNNNNNTNNNNIGYMSSTYDYDNYNYNDDMTGNTGNAVDLMTSDNHNSDQVGYNNVGDDVAIFGDFEETKNYWNELLNLVTTPMEPHVF